MPSLSQKELDEIYAFAVDLGRKAGQLLLNGVEERINGGGNGPVAEKDNAVDIVTQTDEGLHRTLLSMDWAKCFLDVEGFIKTAILDKYPSHKSDRTSPCFGL